MSQFTQLDIDASTIKFFVPGLPKTAGSKRAFMRPGMRFPVVVDACKTSRNWKSDVKQFASGHAPKELLSVPIKVMMEFRMPRPKGHYGSGKNLGVLKPNAPTYHTSRPDALKMARAVEDALTGVIYADDSIICHETLRKVYSDAPGVAVFIAPLES